jgi:protein gp37
MSESSIPWTDYTFNPWWGCTKIAPACAHVGGESGTKARPFDPAWARATVAACRRAAGALVELRVRSRDKKGANPAEWPEDLRVRQFPRPEAAA